MTKDEAIVKTRKIIAIAKGNTNPHEKEAAMRQAKKLMVEHNITAEEIDSQAYLAAYDEISKEIVDFTAKDPIVDMGIFGGFNVIGELVSKSKEHVTAARKVSLLKKIRPNKTVILFLVGAKYEPLLDRIETILKNHNL